MWNIRTLPLWLLVLNTVDGLLSYWLLSPSEEANPLMAEAMMVSPLFFLLCKLIPINILCLAVYWYVNAHTPSFFVRSCVYTATALYLGVFAIHLGLITYTYLL